MSQTELCLPEYSVLGLSTFSLKTCIAIQLRNITASHTARMVSGRNPAMS